MILALASCMLISINPLCRTYSTVVDFLLEGENRKKPYLFFELHCSYCLNPNKYEFKEEFESEEHNYRFRILYSMEGSEFKKATTYYSKDDDY